MQYDKADQQNCPRRVVFYGRVSTELEAQISALKNQMNWYLELAEHHPNWTVVGQYADEGISGTGMKTRPSFMKMLRDARKKKFDLIVTREVSRFARNTVDTLVTTRELKQYGVEVYFVNDDIWTMRGDGEVRLTIMASLAQDESRKMSERTKAGIQTSQKKGTYVAGPTPFGYKRDKKAHMLIAGVSCITNFFGNWLLTPLMGARGAALSTGVSYIVFFAMRTVLANKVFYVDYHLKNFMLVSLTLLLFAYYGSTHFFSLIQVLMCAGVLLVTLFCYRQYLSDAVSYAGSMLKVIQNKRK